MDRQKDFINQINTYGRLYEGAGNRLLVVELPGYNRKDADLRMALAKTGLEKNADSVLVLKRNFSLKYQVTMDVFEPRGQDPINPQLAGSWSTMCGNGVRAVARYLLEEGRINCLIKTRSGILPITLFPKSIYRVGMGQFTLNHKDLASYVKKFNFEQLLAKNIKNETVFAGLNGCRNKLGKIDGEPHLVIWLRKELSLNRLKTWAEKIGPQITTNYDYFPQGINTNLVSPNNQGGLNACTFERGVEYVTQSCGTGATVIGSWWLKQQPKLSQIKINMPGGQLIISRHKNKFYLTGPANPIIK
ncbi:MAG: hypothetical protein AAB430_01450 [Patescibacteria group bacterium]